MSSKHLNHNRQFMTGIFVLVFAVFCVVALFLMLSLGRMEETRESQIYRIEFSKGFAGDSALVYMNDSLLFCGAVPSDTTKVEIRPFAEQHVLMVVDPATDRSVNFNVTEHSGRLILRKVDGGMVMMTEQSWENE